MLFYFLKHFRFGELGKLQNKALARHSCTLIAESVVAGQDKVRN